MEYVNLFEELGIKPEEPKKEEKKKAKKPVEKKKTGKQEEKVKLPVTVYTGYCEPVTLTEKEFLGKSEVTVNEAHAYLSSVRSDYPLSISVLQKGSSNVLYLVHKDIYKVEKATLHLKMDARLMFAGNTYDISVIKTTEECDVESEELEKLFTSIFPEYGKVGFIYSLLDNLIVPTFNFPELTEDLDFPVKVGIFGRKDLVIEKSHYLEFLSSKSLSSEDEDEEDENEDEDDENDSYNDDDKTKKEVDKAEKKVIERLVIENYPDFAEGHLELQWNEKDKMIIAKMIEKTFKPATPKKEEYPTNATLSLLYTTIQLTPEMFGGKQKIEKEELRKHIEKDRPEYSEERTSIGYDKEHNLIIMTVSGSRKGLEIVNDDKTAMDKLSSNYALFDFYKDGDLFRVEGNDAFRVVAPKINNSKGVFSLLIPKVPGGMHKIALKFFKSIYERFKTEAMLQLFWDKENEKYFWHLPLQNVGIGHCEVFRDPMLEMKYFLIGDFHSHGYYTSFFSRQDNEDEKGFRIFGVYGDFGYEDREPALKLRAGTGGCFVDLRFTDVFTMDTEYIESELQTLLNFIDLKISLQY